jgi:hypothetical protein
MLQYAMVRKRFDDQLQANAIQIAAGYSYDGFCHILY